jgi:hypothetical protein
MTAHLQLNWCAMAVAESSSRPVVASAILRAFDAVD